MLCDGKSNQPSWKGGDPIIVRNTTAVLGHYALAVCLCMARREQAEYAGGESS